jgi:hypothetical protein
MGLLDRLTGKQQQTHRVRVAAAPMASGPPQPRPHDFLQEGEIVLHAVGESHYEPALAKIRARDRRAPFSQVWAVLQPEPHNRYDANAVAVLVDRSVVGYLCREDAALLQPVIARMAQDTGQPVQVKAAICGGFGSRIGVQLIFDPLHFGVAKNQLTMLDPRGFGPDTPLLRLREARNAVGRARTALDRHHAYLALEDALYRLRDQPGNLAEFEAVCEQHHAEMHQFVPALLREFGRLPRLNHYRQMAIAKDKAKQFQAAIEWCRRGLAVYEAAPSDPEHVEDLRRRIEKLQVKLNKASG